MSMLALKRIVFLCLCLLASAGASKLYGVPKNTLENTKNEALEEETKLPADTAQSKARRTLEEVMNWPVIAVPSVGYAPETSWALGAGGSGYFVLPSDSLKRHSEVSIDGAWTLRHQWYVHLSATLYLTAQWQLRTKLSYRDYPDVYYGIGNTPQTSESFTQGDAKQTIELPYRYTSRQVAALAEPLYRVGGPWWLGGIVDIRYDAQGVRTPWLYMAVGAVAQYDSRTGKEGRSNTYYPHKGLLLKTQLLYTPLWYHDCSPGLRAMNQGVRWTADFRQYIPLYQDLILAYQLYADMLYPSGIFSAPELLPTLGGQDLLRGVRRGMYRDQLAVAAQAELRIPIYRILKGCVFAGIGDAYSLRHWQWATPKVGYGIGLRCAINQAGINLRVDVARCHLDRAWGDIGTYSFYFTVKEAF